MQGGKSGRSQRHQRKQRLSYSYPSPYTVDIFFQTLRSRLWHLVHFLCAAQVNLMREFTTYVLLDKNMNSIHRWLFA